MPGSVTLTNCRKIIPDTLTGFIPAIYQEDYFNTVIYGNVECARCHNATVEYAITCHMECADTQVNGKTDAYLFEKCVLKLDFTNWKELIQMKNPSIQHCNIQETLMDICLFEDVCMLHISHLRQIYCAYCSYNASNTPHSCFGISGPSMCRNQPYYHSYL